MPTRRPTSLLAVLALAALPVLLSLSVLKPAIGAPDASRQAAVTAAIVRTSAPPGAVSATVAGLTDGDTITVTIGTTRETVRLIGVDTPETKHPSVGVECFGPQASAYTASLVPIGTKIWLTRDVSDRDRYGRLLRFVWRQPTKTTWTMVNEELVRNGYAVVSTFPPDVTMVDTFLAAQRTAVSDNIGLWPACGGADTPASPTATTTPRTPTVTRTPTMTRTVAATRSATATRTLAPTSTSTATRTATPTRTPTASRTPSPTRTASATLAPSLTPMETATVDPLADTPTPGPSATSTAVCDPAYPTICLPPAPPDLDCSEITQRYFVVLPPDPHRLDRDGNGVGCESS